MKKSRNGLLELFRFIAAICMVLYHFEWVYIGTANYFIHFYIWVEFFYVISGFYLIINVDKKPSGSGEYVFNQFKKLYPTYLIAFIFSFIVYIMNNSIGLYNTLELLWYAKWEILMCSIFPFLKIGILFNAGGAPTFIPALLVSTLILHYLYKNHKNITKNLIFPLCIILGLSKIITIGGNLSQWLLTDGIVPLGIIRALVDMSVGALFASVVYPKLSNMNKKKHFLILLVMVGAVCSLVIFRNYISYTDLILWIFIFGLLVTELNILGVNINGKINNIMIFLGKMAFPIFMLHYGVILLFKRYYYTTNYLKIVIFVLITLICLSQIIFMLGKLINKVKEKFLIK